MDELEIKKEIKNFIHASTQDDHEATNASLEKIVKAKVENRYNDARKEIEFGD